MDTTRERVSRVVFHVDMDAFFASIEQLENSTFRGKPLIVGGVDSRRGVVSSASYEARVFGVHSAMPVSQARLKCPHGIFVTSNFPLYSEFSRRLMDCLSEFTPLLEQVSVDEAFLDMTGTEGCLGNPRVVGKQVKEYILKRLKLTASVGIAQNRFLAKLASDSQKPNGLTLVGQESAQSFLDPMPVSRLWGAGKKTVTELQRLGLYTIKQLRLYPKSELISQFGERFGTYLHGLSQGLDEQEVESGGREKSISHEMTFERDNSDMDGMLTHLLDLSDRVSRRARKECLAGRTVSLVWRDPDFTRHSRSLTLKQATHNSQEIYGIIRSLFLNIGKQNGPAHSIRRRFRLLGVRLSHFEADESQLDLFGHSDPPSRVDIAMDAIRDKFGEGAVQRSRLLAKEK